MKLIFIAILIAAFLLVTIGYDMLMQFSRQKNKERYSKIQKEWDELLEEQKKAEKLKESILSEPSEKENTKK
jgi:hypothetical protein